MLINSHLWISMWWIAQQRRLRANISKCALTGLRHFQLKQPTTSTVRRRMCLNVFQSSAIFAPKVPEAIWWHFHRTRRWQQMAHFTGMNKCKQLNFFHWICKMSRQCQVHFYFHSKFFFFKLNSSRMNESGTFSGRFLVLICFDLFSFADDLFWVKLKNRGSAIIDQDGRNALAPF